jgi:hypothetical protein
MEIAGIVFSVIFTVVMAPMMWRIHKQLRRERYLDSIVEQKRANHAGLGPWPENGHEATAAFCLQVGDWRGYDRAMKSSEYKENETNEK